MIIHIVIFKFKEENKKENICKTKELLEGLLLTIDVLNFMEVGVNFNPTERAFDMSIYTKFDTTENLHLYATDPEHLKVLEFIKAVTLETKVVDYELDRL